MIDPTKCTIVKNPVVVNGKITYTATMTFHVKEEIDVHAMPDPRDFAATEQFDQQVHHRLHKLVWAAIYGDLIAPCSNLIIHARRNCPPNFEDAMLRTVGTVITLLKIKLKPSEEKKSPTI